MNMKKKIGVFATVFAALLCALPQSAQASGKIRRVDVIDPDGNHTFPNSTASALTVGDKIQIKFRLVNVNADETKADPTYVNPWEFVYTGTLTGNETLDQLMQLAANKPRLGLWISGRVREAECISGTMGVASDWLADKLNGEKHFTDLIFEYTVQAGDIALPLQFANASGTGPSVGEEPYYLKFNGQEVPWKIVDKQTHSVTSDFQFGFTTLSNDPDFSGTAWALTDWVSLVKGEENRALTLAEDDAPRVYIQAIDFDSTYFDEGAGVWRSIAQNATTADPGNPSIEITGGAATPMTLYVWTDSTNIAEVVKGGKVEDVTEYTFHDGVTRKVGRVSIIASDESVPFSIRATGSVGDTTQVFLAPTPTNIFNAGGTDILTNFLMRTVKVGEPLPPSITVTVNGKAKETVTANSDYATSLVGVNVTLSEPYNGGAFKIPIKVSVKDHGDLNATNYVGISTLSTDDNTAWDDELEISANATSASFSLWMYANRGSIETESSGLVVEVDTNRMSAAELAFFTGKFLGATVVVNRSTPVVTKELSAITAEANTDQEITVNVADAYGELHDPCKYTVYWSNTGNDSPSYYTELPNIAATASGDLTFKVKYSQKGDYNSLFYVVNQDGKESTRHPAAVSVTAQKVVEAKLVQTRFAESKKNQPVATFTFGDEGFSMPDGSSFGYVFLVPRSSNASNLVYCSAMDSDKNLSNGCDWKAGYRVKAGYTGEEVAPLQMMLLDGDEMGLSMDYDIIVRTDGNFDSGTLVTGWSSKGLTFDVTNVVPNVTRVTMSGTRLTVNGGVMGATAALGVNKLFSAATDEPVDADLKADSPNYTDENKRFTTEWTFDYGSGAPDVKYVYGPPSSTNLTYAFKQAGTCTVTVRMCDKDMDHDRDEWGPEFTFTVNVDAKPAVSISPYYGTTAFTETQAGNMTRMDVNLSVLPEQEITVALTVARAEPFSGTDSTYPLPTLSTYTLNFGGDSPNTTNAYFIITSMDGTEKTETPGFIIYAAVTNTTTNSDGVMWTNLYRMAQLPITIANVAPEITTRWDTNAVEVAINTPFDIPYRFTDNSTDMAAGETLYWTITGERGSNYVITTSSSSYSGNFTTKFTSSGTKTVQLQVKDKDDGWSEIAVRHYIVKASKELVIYPRQPNQAERGKSGLTALSKKWAFAPGIGDGRVWADGAGSLTEISDFKHVYTYAPSRPTAYAHAHGYKVGDVDDGSLTPGTDHSINRNGNNPGSAGNWYVSEEASGKDSFFYAWLQTTGEDGTSLTTSLLNIAPAFGAGSTSEQPVGLPKEEKDATSYPDTILEAIFAKEYLATDNLGDINQDTIPDIYAVATGWNGGSLLEAAGVAADEGGDVDTKFNAYNDDGDYLPSRSFEGGLPNSATGWTTLSVPFSADWEIRGFHEGLNHRASNDGMNPYVRGAWISTPWFSEAETNAVAFWNLGPTNTWAFFKANAPTGEVEYAEAYTAWTNDFWTALMKGDSWIPEKRTDPTMWDTDNDSFPDGYEYYFWYRAAVGAMDGTNWVQMTGSRFTLNNIAKGEEITPREIMEAFDPTVKASGEIASRDTDNDGLTDLEEFAMGTNPVHWDSDGDGMSDLWEVMRGMNPLKAPSNPEMNQDGDFMAAYTTDGTYAIVTMSDGTVFALPQNGSNLVTFERSLVEGGTNVSAAAVFGTEAVSNVSAVAAFRYGDDSSTCVPKALGDWVHGVKPTGAAEVNLAGKEIVSIAFDKPLLLIHNQVYNQFGFDPRTGWYKNNDGLVGARWNTSRATARYLGDSGRSINTVPYNCTDEYRLLKYRYETGLRSAADDIADIKAKKTTVADVLMGGTTNPNKPFTEAAYTVTSVGTDGGGSAMDIPTYTSANHGADTDEDGIPDGWELYVGANPNVATDATGDGDSDGLTLVSEYAGTDSCNAYESAQHASGTSTIFANHPGTNKGWYNKFFPTDPASEDTDGDGIFDSREGSTWSGGHPMTGRSVDGLAHQFTFIYGDPSDDGSCCIRGGGLNPCTVDTDFDLLPDPWERQYAGAVFTAGRPWQTGDSAYGTTIPFDNGQITAINRNDNLGTNVTAGVYITAGMDGTFGPRWGSTVVGDAVTSYRQTDPRTGTRRNFDFDNDGLQNFQEYLVQTLRHLRYDDTETPLMGSYLPSGVADENTQRKYVGFLPMQVWDGVEFYKTARAKGFTGISAWQTDGFRYDQLGYFARPPMAWDSMALRTQDGMTDNTPGLCANYDEPGYRILLPPNVLSPLATADSEQRMSSNGYVSTDPRMWDTDNDGMDDYYELFHGLNPILGGDDVISLAYATILPNEEPFSALCNAWTGWQPSELVYDAMRFPWAMGVAEADADGDGLRNTDEALLVNMPNPLNYHTDPTPLWMTDSSSKISFTSQYYGRDPYMTQAGTRPDLSGFFWFSAIDGADPGGLTGYNYAFEENEGYDTDHDWIPDEQELTHAVTSSSDAMDATDPDRRQAMYFPGEESVVASYSGNLHRRIGENYGMLRTFSAETWVRPEDLSSAQTILTRVSDYPSSTLSNAQHRVRANFRIAIEAGGRVYGQYDTDDAVPSSNPKGFGTTTVEGITLETNKWSHVALTFDGNALILYVNGREVNRSYSNLIPANGLIVTLQEVNPAGANFGIDGYTNYPSALLVGADAAEIGAITVGPDSAWTNYCAHYKGWVDEVRVWDGARTAAQIASDYKKRYSLEDVSDLRDEVYAAWLGGGTHNQNDGNPDLPAELLLHYGFQQLPSDVLVDNVAAEPSGFTEKVFDNLKWNGFDVDIRCGWWTAVPIASTVYRNRAIVPWLRNTCSVLPALDGSTYDSRHWSDLLGGVTFPNEVGVAKFLFPNAANPYPYWNYMAESYFREQALNRLRTSTSGSVANMARDAYNRFRFDNRTFFVGGSDLLPLGGAYAKRCPDFWDGHGSTDAWTVTADDTDDDGLPDWWEEYAAATYGADIDSLTTATKVNYTLPSGAVVQMSAWEAYQIDLARGLLPDGKYYPAYESMADNNDDGLPDWWQKLYDVYGLDPDDDPDNDGLSIYQEWLISWGDDFGFGVLNGYPFLSPTKARSGDAQEVTDYFLKSTTAPYEGYYIGEIVADFDMMEDIYEDAFGTDDMVFDAWSDYDEDGWSAWSELRYSTFKMTKAGQFVSHYVGDTEVSDSPEPVIHTTLRYNGEAKATSTNTTFVVQAYAGNNMLKAPTATYVVRPGTSETRFYYLGMQENRVIHGTFTPGFVQNQKGSLALQFAYVQPADTYSWRVAADGETRDYSGTYKELRDAILRYGSALEVAALDFKWQDVDGAVPATDGTRSALSLAVDPNTQKGHILIDMEIAGDIDCTTGDFTFDFSKIAGHTYIDSGVPSAECFYRIRYDVKLPTMQNRKLSLSLGKPTTGALVEGSTAFTAFIDFDGDGAFTPGAEPFGFVKNVDVGWDNVPELVIEMTDSSAAAGKRVAYAAGGTNAVRIVRTAINGKDTLDNGDPVKRRIVYSRDVTATDRNVVDESDLVTAGKFGLDWSNLRSDVEAMSGLDPKSVLSVTYTVTAGGASVMNIDTNDVVDVFTVSFPAEQSKPAAVSPSPLTGPKVETQRPTFKWTGTEDNTAFILQILDAEDNPVYTSDLQVLPARDSSGAYVWTAPVYVGTNVCTDAWSLDNGTNYSWRVAMFSPKFSNTNLETAVWSDATAFETRLAEGGARTSAYSAADVTVRYFGPATNDLSSVVVQLYKTADFTGEPAAQSRLFDVDGKVELLTNNTYTVRFLGLEEGTYYAMAFIDRNGDCVRQRSESWGYANQVGTGVEELYTPVVVKIVSKSGNVPSVEVFMEDTDVNRNRVPDCLDDDSLLTAGSAAAGADISDVDGDGLTADEENGDTYTSASLWDSDGDGMPDGWEAMFAGTDPLTADADTVIDGDVMAYAEETWKLVTDAAGNSYLVNPTNATVRVGDDLPLSRLVSSYDYAGKYGIGTNLTDTATIFRVDKIQNVTAVRVHAQVYEKYGYSPLTAVPVDGAVNTKPFTALDKYLLVRYFEALGFCTEAEVNANRDWANYTLKPNDADNDRDEVLDGWELYTMFGPEGADAVASLADAKISPFNYDDARTTAPGAGSALTVIEEFDGGNTPTDPWQTTTAGLTGLPDEIAYLWRIKSDADLLADYDNDGLSNWAEYLASQLTGEFFDVTDPCSVVPNRLDYFYQITQGGVTKYIGECIDADGLGLIADHDFMEDINEDLYDVALLNRYSYDPLFDADGDGWSNYAEARAGTKSDRSVTLSIDNYQYPEYPTPLIKANFVYNGGESLGGGVVLQAYRAGSASSDAEWSSASQNAASQNAASQNSESQESESEGSTSGQTSGSTTTTSKILGAWRDGTLRFILSPSNVRPGSINIQAKDLSFSYRDNPNNGNWSWPSWNYYGYYYDDYYGYDDGNATNITRSGSLWYSGTAAEARWFDIVIDRQQGDDSQRGDLIYNKYITGTTFEPRVVGWIDYETGLGEIDFSSIDGYFYKNVIADVDGSSVKRAMCYTLENSYFRVSHKSEFVTDSKRQLFYFSVPDKGMLFEGKYNFMAFIDANGDGAYTIGEPMGIARDVNVGWDRVSDLVIELTDDAVTGSRFAIPAQTNGATRVRINRTAINGIALDRKRTVYVKTLDLTHGRMFSEVDFIKDGEYDFDWANLIADAQGLLGIEPANILNATYAVYLDSGDPTPIHTFTRSFDAVNLAPAASGASALNHNVIATAQPSLMWKGSDGYPAFVLQVAKDEGFTDVIYSVTNLMPAATADGCQFKPDLYVGDGLDDGSDYYWRVAQLNSKFTTNVWSAVASFKMQVDSSNADTGYGKLSTEVRYFGSATNDLTNVIVGVYESADFVSMPVARVRLSGEGKVSVLTNDLTQTFTTVATSGVGVVKFDGIKPGAYYLMAFIDANGNSVRDPWETWGYANKVGTGARDLYTPVPVTVVSTKSVTPSAYIVMEDTDINQNMEPDCVDTVNLEGWKPSSDVKPDEPTNDVDTDGDGLTDADEDDYGTDPKNPDTDDDGLPDGWEVKNGTDPLFADSNLAGANDVMAYKADTLTVMVATNAEGSVTNRFVVNSRFEDGYAQMSNTVYTVFEVNGQLFVGAPTNRAAATDGYMYGYMTTNVVVMHSAVYDFYGYDPTTAKPVAAAAAVATDSTNETATAAYGVNTVPFTALLKYVTQQYYLKEFGDATNDFALAVNKLDSNANYLPDGYELYVRYATWHDPEVSYADADARASYGDNFAQVPYDPYDEFGLWNSLVASGDIGAAATNFVSGVSNAVLAASLDAYTNDWAYANGVMAYARTTAHVATNGTEKYVVVVAGADDPDGVAEGAVKTVLETVELPNGELVAWGATNAVSVAGLPVGEGPVTLVHRAVYLFYGFEADTARGCIGDGAATAAAADDGSTNAVASAGSGHTAPFTHAWRYFTREVVGYADPVEVVYDFEDGAGDGLADGWQLYVGASDATAYRYGYDPADERYFYNMALADGTLPALVPPYDNLFAVSNGLAGATAEEQKAFWDWAPADDYMAYVQTNVLISVVTNADGEASIYAIDPGTNTLYETFYVGNELFVGALATNEAAYSAMENGDFMTMVTNATVIHSAVYDWYGFDPTTAKPSYWWPESIAMYAESNSNYTVGANSVPFTRRLKYITQTMYLPLVDAEDDYFLTTSWTVDPSTWWTDTNGNDMPDGWELYVKYSAFSDPDKTDDEYKEDFIDGSDPNSEDTDGDGIPDDVEQYFGVTDPIVKDGDLALEGDVMAFATVNATVVTVMNTADGSLPARYLLAEEMAGNTVTAPKVGDYADSLALRATYDYLVPTDAGDGSVTNRCGVGTNVTLKAAAGTANRVVAVSVEPVVLVHAQVYDYFGFNKETANATAVKMEGTNYVYGANTKAFTALDKYLVVRYLEAYGLADAKADWKALALSPASSDNDIDGVHDGWELYVMFGPGGTRSVASVAAAKISPWNYDDARALAPAGDVTVIEKWNGGAPAYDPWKKDSNGDGVDDADEIKYGLDEPYGDDDNDQLPNFTEFLIGTGFSQYPEFAGVADISATNTFSLTNLMPDYFRRIKDKLYLGEMFTDHDFMEDLWEDQFDVTKVTRGLYDPWRDSDGDGWSNYAECRADTNPAFEANTYGMKGMVVKNYPVPTIHAKVVMGPGEGMLNGTVVIQAYSETSKLTGLPDAIWTVPVGVSSGDSTSGSSSSGSGDESTASKYLGVNPNGEVAFTLSPGFVKPGSISMSFLDPDFGIIDTNGVVTARGDINAAEWQAVVEDRPAADMATGLILVSTPTNSLEIGTIDYHTGLMTVDYAKLPAAWTVVAEGNDSTNSVLLNLANSHVSVSWKAAVAGGNPWMTLHLTDSDDTDSARIDLGHVREGRNAFVVFCDTDESGTWNPGEPYGVANDVDVGWSEAEFTVELTHTTPIMARFDLVTAIGNGSGGEGGAAFEAANAATDRGTVNTINGYWANEPCRNENASTNMPANAESLTRVRVVRSEIDDLARTAYTATVLDRYLDLSVHPSLTEADLLADGEFDLDWEGARTAVGGMGFTKVTYRVVIGDDDVGDYEATAKGQNLPVLFSNRFEPGRSQTATVPDPELAQIVYPSRPTFRWSHTNAIDKAYPAFQLRIYADAGKSTVVYDSGIQRAPARDLNGMYEWTAPVYAGMVTPEGKVLTTTNNYYWAVSMLDAKFTSFNSSEKATQFRLGTSGNLFDGNEYGAIAVRVKYFGPLVGSLSAVPTTRKNLVRVQAFTSPDFSGLPVAETYVTNVANIASQTVIETNAVIRGVAVNGTYYVRAYIDTDADGVKSDWESWGYNCFVLDPTVASVWKPRPVTVSYQDMMPDATVFIEDADTENDGFPDAWEWNKNGNLTAQGPISGNTFFATVNPNLSSTLSAYSKVADAIGSSTAAAGSLPLTRMLASSVAASLLADSSETTAVRISQFSLESGLKLEVENTMSGGDASGLIVFAKEATVQLSLACATTPDFADAVEVPIKTITISAGDTTVEAVTAEELAEVRAKAPEARFFKAIIKKQ